MAPHENVEVYMGPQTTGASNTTGANNMTSLSNLVIAVIQLGANIAPSIDILSGVNVIPDASRSLGMTPSSGATSLPSTTFLETLHNSLRILELKFHVHVPATIPGSIAAHLLVLASNNIPPTLDECTYASRMVTTWKSYFTEQED
jgi:hypothetical protein